MSFFELDGGDKLKKKASKTTTTAAALKKKKTAAALKKKKTTASAAALKKKKTAALKKKKGGNFLGTVSELFAPSGWENFATAAGLLALEETGRYVNKSKKQKVVMMKQLMIQLMIYIILKKKDMVNYYKIII